MNREHEHDDVIELGAASIETKGLQQGNDDQVGGLIQATGLSNE